MREEEVRATRRDRNAALIDAMLLAAIADGQVSEKEMEVLFARVLERREFEGIQPDELNELVQASARALASAKNFDAILRSLRDRLPDHQNRMLAFGLAAAVAFADQRASRAELGLLKSFQAALGISEEEVAQIVEVVEQGGSLAEALGQPLERLYAEVMVLVTAADGTTHEAEARELVESLAADPLFQGVSQERAQLFVTESLAALAAEGVAARLRVLARGLTAHPERLKAFRLAMRVANASGRPSVAELRLLDLLQATFGIADDEVERIRQDI
jgi:uncharacterized tellurite resistance protein B-like protein